MSGLVPRPHGRSHGHWIDENDGGAACAARLVDALWALYEASGYFNLAGKSEAHFVELRRRFASVVERAARAPDLVCQTAWPSVRGVEAAVSFWKPYARTWMGHQLAKRPGRAPGADPAEILRSIYMHAFRRPDADPDFAWMMGYIEPNVRWMDRAHIDFARRHEGSGEACALSLWIMNVLCDEASGDVDPDLDVGPATAEERRLLARAIRASRPACYVDALDLAEERLDLSEVARRFDGAGLERERAILVARRAGAPVAAAVLEVGEVGINLFNLMDGARLFPLAAGGERAYVALVDAARRWFAARGRESFPLLCERDEAEHAERARLHPMSEACLWIISAAILPAFLDHVAALLDRRRAAA